MWLSVVCILINNGTRHHSGEKFLMTQSAAPCDVHNNLTTVVTRIVVDKSSDHAKTTFNLISSQ